MKVKSQKKLIGYLMFLIMLSIVYFIPTEKVMAATTDIQEGTTYTISSALNEGMVLDVYANGTSNGTNVDLYENNSSNAQKFNLVYKGNGYYAIYTACGKVLDVNGAGAANGTNVNIYEWNGTDAQLWEVVSTGDGYYSLISKCNGLYLDVLGGVATNGTNIQVYEGNGSQAQKFRFLLTIITSGTLDDGVTTGDDIVAYAVQFLGVPYVWGGSSPSGFDCSGLVKYVYAHFGIGLPRTTSTLISVGTSVSKANLQPGDLVFPSSGHVGIYVGNNQIIHAPDTGDVVRISTIWSFYAARRIL